MLVGFAGEERLFFAWQPQRLDDPVERGHAHAHPLASAQAQAQFFQGDVGLGGDGRTHGFDGPLIQAARRSSPVADGIDVAHPPPLAQELAHPTQADRKPDGDLFLRRATRIHGGYHPPP